MPENNYSYFIIIYYHRIFFIISSILLTSSSTSAMTIYILNYIYIFIYINIYIYIYVFIYQSMAPIDVCCWKLIGAFITSLILLFLFASSSVGGVICLFHPELILCISLSKVIQPSSSFETFMVLSLLLILKLHGLHLHFIPFGFISTSFLICSIEDSQR